MRQELKVVVLMFGTCAFLAGQEKPTQTESITAQEETVPVFYAQPGLIAPQLQPLSVEIPKAESCKKMDGRVRLSVMVDEKGQPRDVTFIEPLGNAVDKIAIEVAERDRFQPGTLNSKPVPVAVSVEIKLKACYGLFRTPEGKLHERITLRAQPEQKFFVLPLPPEPELRRLLVTPGREVAVEKMPEVQAFRPRILKSFDPEFTQDAREKKIAGSCLLSMVIDKHGLPSNLELVRSLDPGLDQNAIIAVSRYRFRPALRNGHPVPVKAEIDVNFRLY